MACAIPLPALDGEYQEMLEDLAFTADVGDMSEEEVLAEALSEYPFEPKAIAAAVGRTFMDKRAREASFPLVTACERLDAAFSTLRDAGFVALHAAGGSLGEGMEMVEAAYAAGDEDELWAFVYYHLEDVEKALKNGRIHLAFGTIPFASGERGVWPAEVAGDIVLEALQEAGLETVWDGTAQRRIQVQMTWQRRCPNGNTKASLH